MKSYAIVGIGCFLFLFLGCDPRSERTRFTGSVTEEGLPVPLGTVVLRPSGDTDGPVSAGKIEGGSFSIPPSLGPAPGNYTATVSVLDTGEAATDRWGRPVISSRSYELQVRFDDRENHVTWDLTEQGTKRR